jgi:hypothetical protein
LRIAIWMRRALARFPIGLQAVSGLFQQRRHGAITHRMLLPRQFVRQCRGTLAGPPQRRFGIPARHRLNQCCQRREQLRIGDGHRAPSLVHFVRQGSILAPNPSGRRRLSHTIVIAEFTAPYKQKL